MTWTKDLQQQLEKAWQDLADFTLPVCRDECKIPLSCCSIEYCEFTIDYAKKEYGIDLQRTSNERLPLMGETGCTVKPYLRPLCTAHTCQIGSLGCGNTPEWTIQYFNLRGKVEELEYERKSN